MRSGTKIPENDVDVFDLIDTLQLYGLINDGIDKYNHRNTVQGFINDIVGNKNVPTMFHNSNEATYPLTTDVLKRENTKAHYFKKN